LTIGSAALQIRWRVAHLPQRAILPHIASLLHVTAKQLRTEAVDGRHNLRVAIRQTRRHGDIQLVQAAADTPA